MDCSNNGRRDLTSSRCEFNKKCRRISIKNMPSGITNQDISDLLKPYHYQQIHIDKMSLSCKAVLLDGESACRCVQDLNMKPYRGSRLVVSTASCDFMLCVTQLPEHYTREQFLTLITPFGTPERCFLVHSEVTGKSKGYGCVEYTSKESSIKAKNHLNGKIVGTSTVQVHWLDTIPQSYSGLHSSCIFVEKLPNSYKESKSLRELFSHKNTKPVYCQTANSTVDDFSVIEYSTPSDAEIVWDIMSGCVLAGNTLRVTFCVPGPCGLVILNSLKASRDLKRNNPCGGLLPTPIQKLDHLHFPGKLSGNALQSGMPVLTAPFAQAMSNKDPEIQRLLRALHARLLNIPEPTPFQPLCHDVNGNGLNHVNRPFPAEGRINGLETSANHLCNPSITSTQSRGRSASYDSGVHAADDDVFSSGSSSQEDVKEHSVPNLRTNNWKTMPAKIRFDGQFHTDHQSAFSQIPGSNDMSRGYISQPQALLACQKEDLQRSDSADSAYGGSQESAGMVAEQHGSMTNITSFQYATPVVISEYGNKSANGNIANAETYQMPLSRRVRDVTKEKFPRHHDVPRPEFLFSSLCKHEEFSSKLKETSNRNEPLSGSSFTQHRSHSVRTPLLELSSPCLQRKGLSNLMNDLHDIGADSPTQIQLLGSSLMEGLLADSPRSSVEHVTESANATTNAGRLIRALNLFSPTEYLNSPHTPVTVKKRTGGMLPSPEPSPEAGAYVGQHSQGLGGHYAGALFGSLFSNKRRKSNET